MYEATEEKAELSVMCG